jgi:hypothetical protein
VSVIERTLLIYDDDENRLRAYANANRLGDSATALRALLDNADQLAGAVEDRAKLFAWIHEISGHFVDPAGACRSCAILASYLELSGGASAQSDAQSQTEGQA